MALSCLPPHRFVIWVVILMPKKRGRPKDPTRYKKIRMAKRKKPKKINYNDYISSPAWKKKRGQRILIDNKTCQMCGATNVLLNVHHITYDSLGNEDMKDLITLCVPCHARVHEEMKGKSASTVRKSLALLAKANLDDQK